MKIIINIGNRQVLIILLFIIAASAIGLVVAYGGTNPSQMGHSWGEMACDNTLCVNSINGNVGIGTTNPGAKLQVAGDIDITGNYRANGIPLSQLKFLSMPVNKITWTGVNDWTDVNIGSDTGSDTAKAALLMVEIYGSGSSADITGLFRKNGFSATTILPRVHLYFYWEGVIPIVKGADTAMLIVECDGSEIFETKLQGSIVPSSFTYKVDLIGYFV